MTAESRKRSPRTRNSFVLEMHIPISFNQGGSWQIGETPKVTFPKEKPPKPHLFQGHAPALRISDYAGRSLEIKAPEYSFLQLTDNREWNWSIFHFRCNTPLAGAQGTHLHDPLLRGG